MMGADTRDLDNLARDLGGAGALVALKASLAIRKAGADIQGHAKRFAPVDTGHLRSAIVTKNPNPLTAEIMSTADYAFFQEYGTRYQPGTPHMGPALDQVLPTVEQALGQIGEGIL